MRWDDFGRSDNVEDNRGGGGGFGGGLPGGRAGGLGIGTIVVLGLVGWALGIDPRILIGGAEILGGGGGQHYEQRAPRPARTGQPTDQTGQFVSAVLKQTEDRWGEIFSASGQRYRPPKLRLYSRVEPGGCGMAQAAMGPFYCPNDQRIYLDTSFFDMLQKRFGSCSSSKACEFAETYVITHEVGHHVQNLLGILPQVQRRQQAASSKAESNALQVRVELQADCLAGLWANREDAYRKRQGKPSFLDPGDVETAMRTAAAIGDDTLHRSRGEVVPDSFTPGTSAQRQRWFMTGFKEGTIASCNTFKAAQL
jgi:predicted metalloprotease